MSYTFYIIFHEKFFYFLSVSAMRQSRGERLTKKKNMMQKFKIKAETDTTQKKIQDSKKQMKMSMNMSTAMMMMICVMYTLQVRILFSLKYENERRS